jgi:hypothetical protein
LRTSGTLKNFFSGIVSGWPWENNGTLTKLCKASALFERATRLAASWRPVLPSVNEYYNEFVSLDTRIEEFKASLESLESFAQLSPTEIQQAYTVHCIAHSATIQLHAVFASQTAASRTKCLSAAFAVIQLGAAAQVQNFSFLDHAAGVSVAASVFLRDSYADAGVLSPCGQQSVAS